MGKLCKINKFILQLFCYRFVTFCFLNTFWAFLEVKVFLFGIFNENAMFNTMAYLKNRKDRLFAAKRWFNCVFSLKIIILSQKSDISSIFKQALIFDEGIEKNIWMIKKYGLGCNLKLSPVSLQKYSRMVNPVFYKIYAHK